MTETAVITAKNRAAWDASAQHHGRGAYWDELVAGFADQTYSRFDDTLTKHLKSAGIRGAKTVQIGCNNGRETLSLCALGAASSWGIDQSAEFLAQAEKLKTISGHNATFLKADIYALPDDIPRDFNVALITIGVLNWMPDLPRFFNIVASLLRPGGRLVVYETHPVMEIFDPASTTPYLPLTSYFRQDPFIESSAITYDGSNHGEAPESHWFVHTLGTIIQSALDAGLALNSLHEYPHSIREVEYDIYEDQDAQLPMSFLMSATKV